ncbi:hypothetical protein QVE09_28400 [Paenibacillus sp. ClWae2A]|uniref:hypothetical protein n=1 Tax=Paenibacillus sp. ClWae2A TaxID=3057177 RepID=UPI0028F4DE2E|nr:hypothetical protein [Paenibacillus sp. ClWae2A]MDT9722821.1 hypothetical protein [Paenibacillus sp. ClWae2A]
MTLQNLFHEKPTKLWNERMVKHGDELFTEERLLMSDQALDTYLHQLIALQETKDSERMMKAVEEVVVRFNEMNEANGYFIETMEREELADFIDKAARLAGLDIQEDEDITEEWREW